MDAQRVISMICMDRVSLRGNNNKSNLKAVTVWISSGPCRGGVESAVGSPQAAGRHHRRALELSNASRGNACFMRHLISTLP